MDLLPYIESVRVGVANASSLADEQTQHVAERLGTAIESSTRLALIQALSDAAGSISAEMAPSSVELRMVGQDPEFVVLIQTAEAEPTLLLPGAEAESGATGESATSEPDDEPVARITLRLPQSVKARVDEVASSEGISTNAWLIRAVMDALADRSGSRRAWPQAPTPPIPPVPPVPPMPPSPKLIFGETDPFGPEGVFVEKGVFGPKGPFGPGGMFADRLKESWREMRRSRGNVQGWVR
jgi:Arc-like DNA binding domain